MMKTTKSGGLDRRTKEFRQRQQQGLGRSEAEELLELILPSAQAASAALNEAYAALSVFRREHPELAAMEKRAAEAMAENNRHVLKIGQMLKHIELADQARWRAWCAFLNGDGPDPRAS